MRGPVTETAVRRAIQRQAAETTAKPRPGSRAELLHIQRTQGNEAVELLLRAKRAKKQAKVEGDGKEASLNVEIANTPEQRHEGLRYREDLPRNLGLLFLNERPVGHTMAGTEMPLSIAYLDRWGKILELREGAPGEKKLPSPSYQYRHALEVNRGWFRERGLGVGSKVRLGGEAKEDAAEETSDGPSGAQGRTDQQGSAGAGKRRDEEDEQEGLPGTEFQL